MDGQWNGNWAAFCALSFVGAFVAVAFVRVGWMGFIERLLVCLSVCLAIIPWLLCCVASLG
jgi:hypothetical protein